MINKLQILILSVIPRLKENIITVVFITIGVFIVSGIIVGVIITGAIKGLNFSLGIVTSLLLIPSVIVGGILKRRFHDREGSGK